MRLNKIIANLLMTSLPLFAANMQMIDYPSNIVGINNCNFDGSTIVACGESYDKSTGKDEVKHFIFCVDTSNHLKWCTEIPSRVDNVLKENDRIVTMNFYENKIVIVQYDNKKGTSLKSEEIIFKSQISGISGLKNQKILVCAQDSNSFSIVNYNYAIKVSKTVFSLPGFCTIINGTENDGGQRKVLIEVTDGNVPNAQCKFYVIPTFGNETIYTLPNFNIPRYQLDSWVFHGLKLYTSQNSPQAQKMKLCRYQLSKNKITFDKAIGEFEYGNNIAAVDKGYLVIINPKSRKFIIQKETM